MISAGVLAIAAIAGGYILLYSFLRFTQDKREPPLLCTAIPFLSLILDMAKGGANFYNDMRDKYGLPIYTLRLPGSRMYIINSTALIPVVQRQQKTISFSPVEARAAHNVMGGSSLSNDILTSDIESPNCYLETFRTYTHPTLMPGQYLDAMNRTSVQRISASLDKLGEQDGGRQVISLFAWVTTEMSLASTDAVYGPRNPFRAQKLEVPYSNFESGFIPLMIGVMPSIVAGESIRGREKLVDAFREYYRSGGHEDSGVSELVRSRFRHNSDFHIPLDDIARFEIGSLFAILGNTVPATFWLIFHIFSNPVVLADIRRELWQGVVTTTTTMSDTAVTGTGGQGNRLIHTLDLNHIKTGCPILLSTFKEVLRFRGTGVSTRTVTRDHLLDNTYLLKKGSTLMIPSSVQHSDPTIWGPTVGVFDHRRFLGRTKDDDSTAKIRLNPVAFRGFGGGSLLCPGRHFASTEILALAALVAVRFDLRPTIQRGIWKAPKTDNAPRAAAVPRPDTDIEVEVRVCEQAGQEAEWRVLFSGSDKPMEISAEDTVAPGEAVSVPGGE